MILTIITVTYNAEKTIGRTLHSVECQDIHTGIQHIIMDGASTDSTISQANAYKQRNPDIDITIVSEPDHGLYHAMNKALTQALGNYVCFLNAGDKLHATNTLSTLMPMLQTRQYGVIYGDTDIVADNGTFLQHRHLTPPDTLNGHSFADGMLVCHQSFYARRDLCPQYNTQYRFSADVDWCIRILQQTDRLQLENHHTHTVLTDYLDEGMTTRNHRKSLIERFKIMAHHYGLITTLYKHFTFIWR